MTTKIIRYVLTFATSITFLACLWFAVQGILIAQPFLTFICLLLAAFCGYFLYADYLRYKKGEV